MNSYWNSRSLTALILITLTCNALAEEVLIEAQGRPLTKSEYPPKIERTENTSKLAESKFFNAHLKKLIRFEQDKTLISTDGRIGVNSDNGWTTVFVIGINDKFRPTIDDHGSTEYQLVKIGDKSVTIRYKSEFNHNSFGKNLITIDEGTFEAAYKE
ncbi:MAG: hypothetical protein HN764_13520 [Gammaproteobacteria bacterium]|jgi:hypothetical protein|nr:hypothetical protein [Gammaproteobacteria bacterium]